MLPTRSPEDNPLRAARAAVLSGQPIPALASAQLAARGIDAGELEQRLIQNQEYRH